jgi:hypothetical protein
MAQQDMHRRYSAFDEQKKEFQTKVAKTEADVEVINQNLKKMSDLSAQGKHWEALRFMANMAGLDPLDYQKNFVKQAKEVAKKFEDYTEEEESQYWRDQEGRSQKEKESKEHQTLKSKLAVKEAEDAARAVIYDNGISEFEFSRTYLDLKKAGHLDALIKQGMAGTEITQRVCDFHKDASLELRIYEAIEKVKPALAKDKTLVDKLFKYSEHGDTVEDVVDILQDYLGVSATSTNGVEPSGGEPNESRTKKVAGKASKSEKVSSKSQKKDVEKSSDTDPDDILGFDDIFDTYGRG